MLTISVDFLCELSAWPTIHTKCQNFVFSVKKDKNCRLLLLGLAL